jgi:hypothetical protein
LDDEKKREYITVIPSARRLVNSLRNLKYDFVRAVADIVDNSIQAGATKVDIVMKFDGWDSWIRIADNGKGMNSQEITEAMRLGTKRDYGANELGKFGLGMKLASLSQCRKLTVASRSAEAGNSIEIRELNLDHIEQSDRWEVIDHPPREVSQKVIEPLMNSHGTVVFWEHLDRMMKFKIASGAPAQKKFNEMARDLELHLSMVFHRFLAGEVEGKKLEITLNRNLIKPWDPFARAEERTWYFDDGILTVQGKNKVYTVRYSAYILPPQDSFSSGKAFEYYGRGHWNELQGLYIYRENRLIRYGGWGSFRRLDEHTKLARVAIYFDTNADDDLDIDVKKSDIDMPENLNEQFEKILKKVWQTAETVYRSSNVNNQIKGFAKIQRPHDENTLENTMNINTEETEVNKESSLTDDAGQVEDRGNMEEILKEGEKNLKEFFKVYITAIGMKKSAQKSESDIDFIINGIKVIYSSSLYLCAEKEDELNALEKIKKRMRSDYPDIASFLEL